MTYTDHRMFGFITKPPMEEDIVAIECMFDQITDHDFRKIGEAVQKIRDQKMEYGVSTTLFPFFLIYSLVRFGVTGVRAHWRVQKEMWHYLRSPVKELTRTYYELEVGQSAVR